LAWPAKSWGCRFATHFARYPGDRACVIVLSNLESAPAGRISDALAAILFGKPYDEPDGR